MNAVGGGGGEVNRAVSEQWQGRGYATDAFAPRMAHAAQILGAACGSGGFSKDPGCLIWDTPMRLLNHSSTRQRFLRFRSVGFVGLACACTSGAGPKASGTVTNGAPSGAPPATVTASSAPAGARFLGRVVQTGPLSARYAWPGTGFVVRFRGTAVTLRLRDAKNQHTVTLDGQPRERLRPVEGTTEYPIAVHLSDTEHVLTVVRRTEALFGPSELLGIDVPGGAVLSPPPALGRRIEIIGDSISAGYGNEGADASCPFSADTENYGAAYGPELGRLLGAEVSTVAWSGRGVVRNYAGGSGELMGVLYERTLPEDRKSLWNHSQPVDAVVVNLGTNDFGTEPAPTLEAFASAYASLLETVRSHHPGAFIVCTVGPMLGGEALRRAEAAMAEALHRRVAAGDARVKVHVMRTDNQSPGCDWHPSVATHRRIAAELGDVLKAALGW
jgi:lysophospholipase L1-like esterase